MIFNSLQHFLDQFPSCPFCNKAFDYHYDESVNRHYIVCEDCNKSTTFPTTSTIYAYNYKRTSVSVDWIMFRCLDYSNNYKGSYFGYNSYPEDIVTYFQESIEISTSEQLIELLSKFKKDVRNNKLLA